MLHNTNMQTNFHTNFQASQRASTKLILNECSSPRYKPMVTTATSTAHLQRLVTLLLWRSYQRRLRYAVTAVLRV